MTTLDPTPLLSLVQISDLHVGDVDAEGDFTPQFDATASSLWRFHTLLDGFLGHSHQGMVALDDFCARLSRHENLILLVTGDLTAWGSPGQFQLATDYLTGTVFPIPTGLNVSDAMERAIPGNHDHWPGRPMIVGPETASFHQAFKSTPWFLQTSVGTRSLLMAGIDSDSEVTPYSGDRVCARGKFCAELAALGKQLPPPTDGEVRVLLVHHSWNHTDPRGKLEIVPASKASLQSFLDTHEFHVLLTGHTHVAGSHAHQLPSGRSVVELRCGSSMQLDEPPPAWLIKAVGPSSFAHRFTPNSVLLHRLSNLQGRLCWTTNHFIRTGTQFTDRGVLAKIRL